MKRGRPGVRHATAIVLVVFVGAVLGVVAAIVGGPDDPRVVMLVKLDPHAPKPQVTKELSASIALASTTADLLLVMISPTGEPPADPSATSKVSGSRSTVADKSSSSGVTTPRLASLPSIALGDQGDAVVQLKAALRLVFPHVTLPADDRFDEMTAVMVRRFQSEHGLPNDRIVGKRTWTELQRSVDALRAPSPHVGPSVEQDPPTAGSALPPVLDFVRQLLQGSSVPTEIVVGQEEGSVINSLGNVKVVDSMSRTLRSPGQRSSAAMLWLLAAVCLAAGAVGTFLWRRSRAPAASGAHQPLSGGRGLLAGQPGRDRYGGGNRRAPIPLDDGPLHAPEQTPRAWYQDPIATTTPAHPVGVPQDAAPAAGMLSYLTISPEDQRQCPSCGAFHVQQASDKRRGRTATTFACTTCAYAWTWKQGAPWPSTIVRAFPPLEEP